MAKGTKKSGPVSLQSRLESSSSQQKHKSISTLTKLDDSSVVETQQVAPTDLEIFKGGDTTRLQRAIQLSTDPAPINRIENILSGIPGDFSGSEQLLYFTKQYQVAYDYASYAAQCLKAKGQDIIGVRILHLNVPKELLTNSVSIDGAIWQEFVWNHRLQRQTPDHLQYLDEAEVLTGPVLQCGPAMVAEHVRQGHDFTVLKPVRLSSGDTASQHAFKGSGIRRAINTNGRFWLEQLGLGFSFSTSSRKTLAKEADLSIIGDKFEVQNLVRTEGKAL